MWALQPRSSSIPNAIGPGEWTASPFDGYAGFRAHPYPEYSEVWFDGDHRVAKGGSWATRTPILRASFRNFFRRDFRIGFLGFRCAE